MHSDSFIVPNKCYRFTLIIDGINFLAVGICYFNDSAGTDPTPYNEKRNN